MKGPDSIKVYLFDLFLFIDAGSEPPGTPHDVGKNVVYKIPYRRAPRLAYL